MTNSTALEAGSWRELLTGNNIGVTTLLCGGVALYATNEFMTTSLMPSAIGDIGGERFYVWVATVYLVASVVAATMVGAVLQRVGPRSAYLIGFAGFAASSVCCALAPSISLFLLGRTVQGLAGGLLTGLAYAVINVALPQRQWTRASALVSAMWGVGTLLGPAAGGVLSHMGLWRWAFHLLALLAVGLALLALVALPARTDVSPDDTRVAVPWWSLLVLGLAVFAITVAAVPEDLRVTSILLLIAAVLVFTFTRMDRQALVKVLPPSVFGPGPLKWIYVALGVLMAATMVDVYVPLFGQRLAGLTPVAAGFLGAALAIGWTAGELASASLRSDRVVAVVVRGAPVVLVIGLLCSALTVPADSSVRDVAPWCLALVVTGVGVGMAWPHLSAWAMGAVDDPEEGPIAAAAINIVELICGAFGAGLAGVVVNAHANADGTAARSLFVAFAAMAILGVVACARSFNRQRVAAA